MRIRFLSLGLVGASLLTGSVFSAKLVEIHFYLNPSSTARATEQSRAAEPIDMPERISFRRGAFGETLSGVVTHGKSYVLAARSGQYLSASVSSTNNCVVFNTGSATVNLTAATGDNSLAVVNKCGGPSTFRLAVEIR